MFAIVRAATQPPSQAQLHSHCNCRSHFLGENHHDLRILVIPYQIILEIGK